MKVITVMGKAGESASLSVSVIITVQEQYLNRVPQVVHELENVGLTVDQVLGTLGQVIGHATEPHVSGLSGVIGVESVVPERRIVIAPPDSGIQ